METELPADPVKLATFIESNSKRYGVPQGAPTSCSLATLALRRLEAKLKKILFYADDVIYFPNSLEDDPIIALTDKELGIEVQPSKSKVLMKNKE